MVISEDVWLQIRETQSTSTNSLFWRDFSWRNLTHFLLHLTKNPNLVGLSAPAGGRVDQSQQIMPTFFGHALILCLFGKKWADWSQRSWIWKK